jgi:DnaK suppressor protein
MCEVAAAALAGYNSPLSRLKGRYEGFSDVAVKKPAKTVVKHPAKAAIKQPAAKSAVKPVAESVPKPAKPVAKPAVKSVAKKPAAKQAANPAPVAKPAPKVEAKAPPAKGPVTKASAAAKAPAAKPAVAKPVTNVEASATAKPPMVPTPVPAPPPTAQPKPAPAPPVKPPKPGPRPNPNEPIPKVAVKPMTVAPRTTTGKVAVAVTSRSFAPPPKIQVKVISYKTDEANGRPLLPTGYKPSVEEGYMSPLQLEYFRKRLLDWRADLVEESKQTIENLKDEVRDVGDDAERATRETENSLELRTRDRYRKLIGKIDSTLKRVESGEYGYSVDSGEEIGLHRLEARLTAERTIDEQERWEHLQKQQGD